MKIDRSLQLRYARKRWRAADACPEKVYWLLQYTKGRYLLSCRPCGKGFVKNKRQKAMRKFWQAAHSKIEEICLEHQRPFEVFERATSQNFETHPHYQNNPLSAKQQNPLAKSNCQVAVFDAPHGWYELISKSVSTSSSEETTDDWTYTDLDEDDPTNISWTEFYRRLCLFEEKMEEKLAKRRARFQNA